MDEKSLQLIVDEQLVDFKDVIESLEASIPREAPSESDMDKLKTYFVNTKDKIQEQHGGSTTNADRINLEMMLLAKMIQKATKVRTIFSQHYCRLIGRSKEGDTRDAPRDSNSFIFMQFSSKNMQNKFLGCWRTPLRNILDPPLYTYYLPQTKLREGNVLTPVCDSAGIPTGVHFKLF